MREFLGSDYLANTARQLRGDAPNAAIVLVEGPTDSRFFRSVLDDASIRTIPSTEAKAQGQTDEEKSTKTKVPTDEEKSAKEKVLAALAILNQEAFEGVLAIVDADFCRLDDDLPEMDNLFFTDEHDLEGILIKSKALDKLLEEYATPAGRQKPGIPIRKALLKACKPLGLLRWFNHQHQHGLNFQELKADKFISKKLVTDQDELVRLILARSKKSHLQKGSKDFLKRHEKADPWQVCQGHDLVAALTYALKKVIASHKHLDQEFTAKNLRLAYESAWFKETHLFQALCAWQEVSGRSLFPS